MNRMKKGDMTSSWWEQARPVRSWRLNCPRPAREHWVIESGGPDDAPTIANPSIWFYNVGGPLDYHLPSTRRRD
jgi:hypothetical protein